MMKENQPLNAVSPDKWSSTTAHLLRSPKNAERLAKAIAESEARNEEEIESETLEDLIADVVCNE